MKMVNFAQQQIINRIRLLNFRYFSSFPSDYVPTLDNETFAIINTQPSNMQGKRWIMIAIVRLHYNDLYCILQTLCNADSLHCNELYSMNCILQTLLIVRGTVFSTTTTTSTTS